MVLVNRFPQIIFQTNIINFKYIGNLDCSYCQSVDLIIYILSSPTNFDRRNNIRSTWGSIRSHLGLKVKHVFIIGSRNDSDLQTQINKEKMKYNDIVQGNFMDNYANLIVKTRFAQKWVAEFCVNSQYVLKTDDDIFINIYELVRGIKERLEDIPENSLFCPKFHRGKSAITYSQT